MPKIIFQPLMISNPPERLTEDFVIAPNGFEHPTFQGV